MKRQRPLPLPRSALQCILHACARDHEPRRCANLTSCPSPEQVALYDLGSLFAGELHAVLCRGWKQRVKGKGGAHGTKGGYVLTGGGHTSISRPLDTELLAKHGLLEPGGELWFSAYVDGADRGRFLLTGPDISLGFEAMSKQRQVLTMLNGEIAGESNQNWSRSADLRFPDNEPALIVGQCVWGKTDDEPDTVRIFRVFKAPVFWPMLTHKPAAVMHAAIPQEKLNSILLETGEQRAFDEIRIGTSPASVLQGTVPMK